MIGQCESRIIFTTNGNNNSLRHRIRLTSCVVCQLQFNHATIHVIGHFPTLEIVPTKTNPKNPNQEPPTSFPTIQNKNLGPQILFQKPNKRKILLHQSCFNENTQNTKTTSRLRIHCQQQYNNNHSNSNCTITRTTMKSIWITITNNCYICNCTSICYNYTKATIDAIYHLNYVNNHQQFRLIQSQMY